MKKKEPQDDFNLVETFDEMNETEIDDLFREAVDFFHIGDAKFVKTSYFMFQNILERNPKYRSADGDNPYFYLGRIHDYYLKDKGTAIKFYTQSLKLFPKDTYAIECRGFCRLKKNKYDLAIKDLIKAKENGGGEFDDLEAIVKEAKKRINGKKSNKSFDRYFEG